MYLILVPLALGAVCVAFFILLFAAGALVGVGSSGVQALRAAARTRNVQAQPPLPKATVRSAFPPAALQARTEMGALASYAAA
jgi:hypothetical protein